MIVLMVRVVRHGTGVQNGAVLHTPDSHVDQGQRSTGVKCKGQSDMHQVDSPIMSSLILLCLWSGIHSMLWFQNGTVSLAPSMGLARAMELPRHTNVYYNNTSVSC